MGHSIWIPGFLSQITLSKSFGLITITAILHTHIWELVSLPVQYFKMFHFSCIISNICLTSDFFKTNIFHWTKCMFNYFSLVIVSLGTECLFSTPEKNRYLQLDVHDRQNAKQHPKLYKNFFRVLDKRVVQYIESERTKCFGHKAYQQFLTPRIFWQNHKAAVEGSLAILF